MAVSAHAHMTSVDFGRILEAYQGQVCLEWFETQQDVLVPAWRASADQHTCGSAFSCCCHACRTCRWASWTARRIPSFPTPPTRCRTYRISCLPRYGSMGPARCLFLYLLVGPSCSSVLHDIIAWLLRVPKGLALHLSRPATLHTAGTTPHSAATLQCMSQLVYVTCLCM